MNAGEVPGEVAGFRGLIQTIRLSAGCFDLQDYFVLVVLVLLQGAQRRSPEHAVAVITVKCRC